MMDPFNPSTTIRYTLAREGNVSLRVFNLIGQNVLTPVRARQLPGSHAVGIDASGLPSGVYLYRVDVDGLPAPTKRMLVAR
jgi:hypothetical protein